jgi:hypothetical protein
MIKCILDIESDKLKFINAILERMSRGAFIMAKIICIITIIIVLMYLISLIITSIGIVPDMSQSIGIKQHIMHNIKPVNTLWM